MAFAPDTPPRALVRYPTRVPVRGAYKPPAAPRLGPPRPPASSGIPPAGSPPPPRPRVAATGAVVKPKLMTEDQWNQYHATHGTTPTGTYDQYALKRGVTVNPYRDLPAWAQTEITRQGAESTAAQAQATKAAQWLASVTAPLVNARSAQDQAFAGNLNSIAGAYTAAGAPGVTPGASVSPGGMASGGGLSHLALGAANAQAATVGPGTQALLASQGLGAHIADLASQGARWAGEVQGRYAKQASDYILKVRQWKSEQDATFLANTVKATGVTAALDATNTRAANVQTGLNTRAAAAQAGANTRTAAQIAAADRRAAAKAKAAGATGAGYHGTSGKDYGKLKSKWVTDAEKLLTVPYDTGQPDPASADPITKLPTKTLRATRTPQAVFDMAVQAGLRPSDALKTVGVTADVKVTEAYAWLKKYLPAKNARAVVLQITGHDPVAKSPWAGLW